MVAVVEDYKGKVHELTMVQNWPVRIPRPVSYTHLRGALTRVINGYAKANGLLKEKDPSLSGEDVREGLVAVISVKTVSYTHLTRERPARPSLTRGLASSSSMIPPRSIWILTPL